MADKSKSIDVLCNIEATQNFTVDDSAPTPAKIKKDFKGLLFTLDPAPPCSWNHKIENVTVTVDKEAMTVQRHFNVSLTLKAAGKELDAVRKMLTEESYYDEDSGFEWGLAINYMIADTTVVPDYAVFADEVVNVDYTEIKT